MTKMLNFFLGIVFCVGVFGCRKTAPQKNVESVGETTTALKRVGFAMSGKDLSDEDVRNLERDVRHDPQTQSAVEAITRPVQAKYCPIDGKHFSGHLKLCPEHNVELIEIKDN